MTNSKVGNSDSAYSISFSQVLLTMFTSLINKEIHNIFNSFLLPNTFNTNQNKQTHTHTQTNINRVLIA